MVLLVQNVLYFTCYGQSHFCVPCHHFPDKTIMWRHFIIESYLLCSKTIPLNTPARLDGQLELWWTCRVMVWSICTQRWASVQVTGLTPYCGEENSPLDFLSSSLQCVASSRVQTNKIRCHLVVYQPLHFPCRLYIDSTIDFPTFS